MTVKVYKVKDSNTNKYSTGGMTPGWTSRGKVWNGLGAVKAHLRQFVSDAEYRKHYKNSIPDNWIVLEITDSGINEIPARSFYPEEKYGPIV